MSTGSPLEIDVRGVLFDMDGVLMSSLGSVERSWRSYAHARSLDPELAIKLAHGRRAIETVRALRPDLDAESELRVIEDLEVGDNQGLVVLPGVRKMLASLPEGSWGIVTSATDRLARSRLAFAGIAIPKYFVTADMVVQGKPHPEPYLLGTAMLKVPAEQCVVIEDAPAGVAAGKAARCQVLAVLTTHPAATLTAADWRVETLEDVKVKTGPSGLMGLRIKPSALGQEK
ncbi:MAG TPA: HAD-IA family hydrolase [Acidobacteriaceae bacterium]|nr:HAD-IA family hydrolase [Acidobacteriaceae bacterium]